MRPYEACTTSDEERFFDAVILHAFTLKNWDGSAAKL
jgi:hypothetical protein